MDPNPNSPTAQVFNEVIDSFLAWQPSDFDGLSEVELADVKSKMKTLTDAMVECCFEDDAFVEAVTKLSGGVVPTEAMDVSERSEANATFKKALLQYIEDHKVDEVVEADETKMNFTTAIKMTKEAVVETINKHKARAQMASMFTALLTFGEDLQDTSAANDDGGKSTAEDLAAKKLEVLTSLTKDAFRMVLSVEPGEDRETQLDAAAAKMCENDEYVSKATKALKGVTLTQDMSLVERSQAVMVLLYVIMDDSDSDSD